MPKDNVIIPAVLLGLGLVALSYLGGAPPIIGVAGLIWIGFCLLSKLEEE